MTPLLLGLSFLTRLPISTPNAEAADLARSTRFYPLAGAVVALVALLGGILGAWLVQPWTGAILAVIAGLWVTGGLHVDGLGDCIDGWLCKGDVQKRLEVMHDPRVGGLSAAWLSALLLLKAGLYIACIENGTFAPALWASCVLSRGFLPWELYLGPAATPGKGLFGLIHPEMSSEDVWSGVILSGALLLPVGVVFPDVMPLAGVGVGLAFISSALWQRQWKRSIGGLNGDVLGAGVEIRELLILLPMASPVLI